MTTITAISIMYVCGGVRLKQGPCAGRQELYHWENIMPGLPLNIVFYKLELLTEKHELHL